MSARLDWKKAKHSRPTEHKSALWASDTLAKRAKRELTKWKKTLPKRQQKRLEAVL
jgi:hypothetical protein